MKVYVSIVDTNGKKRTFALREKPITIGRSQKAHVSINDELSSSIHCSIYLDGQNVFIEDNKSKNGIFLNGVKVFKQRLYIDDVVKIGHTTLGFSKKRLQPEVIQALTGSGNRISGEVDLKLETKNTQFDTNKEIKDKLYQGVKKAQKNSHLTPAQEKLLTIKENIASLIDLVLTLIGFALPIYIFCLNEPKVFKDFDMDLVSSPSFLIAATLALVTAFVFHWFNTKKLDYSIGERLMGLS